eukprot:m.21032 g.21032  ORF g.21032 m.21032 type:complete len:1607 (+) comp5648_c0_seq1:229-5049(+)
MDLGDLSLEGAGAWKGKRQPTAPSGTSGLHPRPRARGSEGPIVLPPAMPVGSVRGQISDRSASARSSRHRSGSRASSRRAASVSEAFPLRRIVEGDARESLGQNRRTSANLDQLRRASSLPTESSLAPLSYSRRKSQQVGFMDTAQLSTSSAVEAIRAAHTSPPPTKLPALRPGARSAVSPSSGLIDWLLEREAERMTKPRSTDPPVRGLSSERGQLRSARPVRDLHWRPDRSSDNIEGKVSRTIGGMAGRINHERGMAEVFPLLGLASNPDADIVIRKLLLHSRNIKALYHPKTPSDQIPEEIREKLSQDQLSYVLRIGGGFVILADGSLLLNRQRVLADGRIIHADGSIYDANGNLVGNSSDEVVLADGTRVLADGTRILPDGTRVLADGTRVLADGTKILPDGTRILADGTKILPDGTRVLADGTRVLADGTRILPDGTKILPDGTRVLADGTRILPDGTKILADGTKVLPDGTRVLADGTRILPDGTKILPDGTKILADGTKVLPDGTKILPDGTTIAGGNAGGNASGDDELIRDLKNWVVDRHAGRMSTEASEAFFEAHPHHRQSFSKFESKAKKRWGKVKRGVTGDSALSNVVEEVMARDAAMKRLTQAHPEVFGFEKHPDRIAAEKEAKESEKVVQEIKAKMEVLERNLSRIDPVPGDGSGAALDPAAQGAVTEMKKTITETAAQVVALRTHASSEKTPKIQAAVAEEVKAVEAILQIQKELAQAHSQDSSTRQSRLAQLTKKLAIAERAFAKKQVETMRARLSDTDDTNVGLKTALTQELEAAELAVQVHDRLVELESEMGELTSHAQSVSAEAIPHSQLAQAQRSMADAERSVAQADAVLATRSVEALQARLTNPNPDQSPEVKVALEKQLKAAQNTVAAQTRAVEIQRQRDEATDISTRVILNRALAQAEEEVSHNLVEVLKVRVVETGDGDPNLEAALLKELKAAERTLQVRKKVSATLSTPKAAENGKIATTLDNELAEAERELAGSQVTTLKAVVAAEGGGTDTAAAASKELEAAEAAQRAVEARRSLKTPGPVSTAVEDTRLAEAELLLAASHVDALRVWVTTTPPSEHDAGLVSAITDELAAAEHALQVRQQASKSDTLEAQTAVVTELARAEVELAKKQVVALKARLALLPNKGSIIFVTLSKELKAAERLLRIREKLLNSLARRGESGTADLICEVVQASRNLTECRVSSLRADESDASGGEDVRAARRKELDVALRAMAAFNHVSGGGSGSPPTKHVHAKTPQEREAARTKLVKELLAAETKKTTAQAKLPPEEKERRVAGVQRQPLLTTQAGGYVHNQPRIPNEAPSTQAAQDEYATLQAQFEQAAKLLEVKKKAIEDAPKTGMLTVGKTNLRELGSSSSNKNRRGLRRDLPKGGQTKRKGEDDPALLLGGYHGSSALDYLSQFCILSDAQTAMYRKVFDHIDTDLDNMLSLDELQFGIRTVNKNMISNREMTYIDTVLELRLVKEVNFRMFSVIAALSERVVGLDRMVRGMVNSTDFRAMEAKMNACKQMFYLLDEKRDGLVPMDMLMYQVRAGRISPEHEKIIIDKFSEDGKTYVDFLDFLTYLLLFLEIHDTINENPFDDRRTK